MTTSQLPSLVTSSRNYCMLKKFHTKNFRKIAKIFDNSFRACKFGDNLSDYIPSLVLKDSLFTMFNLAWPELHMSLWWFFERWELAAKDTLGILAPPNMNPDCKLFLLQGEYGPTLITLWESHDINISNLETRVLDKFLVCGLRETNNVANEVSFSFSI